MLREVLKLSKRVRQAASGKVNNKTKNNHRTVIKRKLTDKEKWERDLRKFRRDMNQSTR